MSCFVYCRHALLESLGGVAGDHQEHGDSTDILAGTRERGLEEDDGSRRASGFGWLAEKCQSVGDGSTEVCPGGRDGA